MHHNCQPLNEILPAGHDLRTWNITWFSHLCMKHSGRNGPVACWTLRPGRARSGGGRAEITSIAAVIGLMPEQRQAGLFGCVPGHAARAAQQIDFRFDSQTDEICHFAHKIGVSARSFPVISDQTIYVPGTSYQPDSS